MLDSKILRMAANWSNIACGVIVVAERDGFFNIIDGQQRTAAALKRSDIKRLPCIVFKVVDIRDEALGFLRANTERQSVKMVDKIKSMLLAGDKIAERIYEIAEDDGRTICGKSDGRSLRCVATLYRNLRTNKSETEKVLPLISRICSGKNISERIVESLVYMEKNGNESINGTKWEKRLMLMGYEKIIKCCNEASAFYSKGGAKVWASGIVMGINKGMQIKFQLKN